MPRAKVLLLLLLVASAAFVVATDSNFLDGLMKLASLHKDGLLSKAEWQAAKKRLLHDGATSDEEEPRQTEQDMADVAARVFMHQREQMLQDVQAMIDSRLPSVDINSDREDHETRNVRELQGGSSVATRVASANVWLQDDKGKVVFGPHADVCLKRDGAGTLSTDGNFVVGGAKLEVDGTNVKASLTKGEEDLSAFKTRIEGQGRFREAMAMDIVADAWCAHFGNYRLNTHAFFPPEHGKKSCDEWCSEAALAAPFDNDDGKKGTCLRGETRLSPDWYNSRVGMGPNGLKWPVSKSHVSGQYYASYYWHQACDKTTVGNGYTYCCCVYNGDGAKPSPQLCIGNDCRTAWPAAGFAELKAAHATLDAAAVKTTTQTITIGGSAEKMYPVWWQFPVYRPSTDGGLGRITVWRQASWNSDTRPLNKASAAHQGGLFLEMTGLDHPWGGMDGGDLFSIVNFQESITNMASHCAFSLKAAREKIDASKEITTTGFDDGNSNPNYSGCYLRGGGVTYEISNNWGATIQYQDGSDDNAKNILTTHAPGNVRWYVTPLDWKDRVAPVSHFGALNTEKSRLRLKGKASTYAHSEPIYFEARVEPAGEAHTYAGFSRNTGAWEYPFVSRWFRNEKDQNWDGNGANFVGKPYQMFDISFAQFCGTITIKVSSGYNYALAAGTLEKTLGICCNPALTTAEAPSRLYLNAGEYTVVVGVTHTYFAVSDAWWSAEDQWWRVTVAQRVALANEVRVAFSARGSGNSRSDMDTPHFRFGAVYQATAATELPGIGVWPFTAPQAPGSAISSGKLCLGDTCISENDLKKVVNGGWTMNGCFQDCGTTSSGAGMDRVCDELSYKTVTDVETCKVRCANYLYMGLACPHGPDQYSDTAVFECWCCNTLDNNSQGQSGRIPNSECMGGVQTSGVSGNKNAHCHGFPKGTYKQGNFYLGGNCRAMIYTNANKR